MITLMPIKNINHIRKSMVSAHIEESAIEEIKMDEEVLEKAFKYAFILDGKQIGYIAYAVVKQTDSEKIAFHDITYFIEDGYRGHTRQIIRLIEKKAKQQGCDIMLWHCITEKQLKFFDIIGYNLTYYIVRKDL
jgi:hypothetical protein